MRYLVKSTGGVIALVAISSTATFLLLRVGAARTCRRPVSVRSMAMAAQVTTSPTSAYALGQYAKQLRGKFAMQPDEAAKRLVPELLEDHHKGQARRRNARASLSIRKVPARANLCRKIYVIKC